MVGANARDLNNAHLSQSDPFQYMTEHSTIYVCVYILCDFPMFFVHCDPWWDNLCFGIKSCPTMNEIIDENTGISWSKADLENPFLEVSCDSVTKST